MSDFGFLFRALEESKELRIKILKLKIFMASDAFTAVDRADHEYLCSQLRAMKEYRAVLEARIEFHESRL